jgi:hypothetical protein
VLSGSLGGKGGNVFLDHFALTADGIFLRVTFLVTDIFQIFDFGLGLRRKILLHAVLSVLIN